MCIHKNKYDDKLIKTYHTEDFEIFQMCDCEDETKVKVEKDIFVYESEDGPNYEVEEVTETCTVCGASRDYVVGDPE